MLNFLFPKECLICLKTGSLLCNKCQKNLVNTLPNCYICKKLSNNYKTHRVCLKAESLSQVITFWKYNEYSRKLIHNFKYKNRFKVGDFIFSLFENKLSNIDKDSVLIPLPSHKKKILERGFNPTQLFCDLISKNLKIDTYSQLISKKGENTPQATLPYKEREKNVKNIFKINNDKIKDMKKYNQFIIVDDIITTGATLSEISVEIKREIGKNINVKGLCIFQGSFKNKHK